MYCCVFDRLDASIGRGPLYLQGGWTYPARNPITRSKYIKIPSCTWIPLGPIRLTGQTRCFDRSDRLSVPVRPVCSGCCQFWSSTPAINTRGWRIGHTHHITSPLLLILHSLQDQWNLGEVQESSSRRIRSRVWYGFISSSLVIFGYL